MNQDKVVLITGASTGIGQATAHEFAKKGFKLAVHGRDASAMNRVVEECDKLSPNGNKAFIVLADFNEPTNAKVVVEKTIKHFNRLDVLVNNAGIFEACDINREDGYDIYKKIMTVNLDATVNLTLSAIDELKKTKGNIVFVSSIASFKPNRMTYPYSMSKVAMNMFAQCLAQAAAPGVRVNIVSPGPIDTPIFGKCGIDLEDEEAKKKFGQISTLLNRIGESEEIGKLIYFLASDDASFITGSNLVADGGSLLNQSGLINIREQLMQK